MATTKKRTTKKAARKPAAKKAARKTAVKRTAKRAAKKKASKAKLVYFFGGDKADGNGKQKELLGGKGANLAEMALIGLPVPAGFTITTEVCTHYYANGRKWPSDL